MVHYLDFLLQSVLPQVPLLADFLLQEHRVVQQLLFLGTDVPAKRKKGMINHTLFFEAGCHFQFSRKVLIGAVMKQLSQFLPSGTKR